MSDNQEQPAQEPPQSNPNELVPEHQPSGENAGAHRDGLRVPTRAEVLGQLYQMVGMIALGLLPPAKANAIRGTCATLLSNMGESPATAVGVVADEDLITVLREKPELLKIFEPFLTPEQLRLVVREATRD